MILYDAITRNKEPRPDPLPGARRCVVDMGAGWLFGSYVGPQWWAEGGWSGPRKKPDFKLAVEFAAKVPKDALYIANVFETGLDVRDTADAVVSERVGGASVVLQAARLNGLECGHYCFPTLWRDGSTIQEWHEANDRLAYVPIGNRRYVSRGISSQATKITPALYSPSVDEAAETLWLAESYRIAAGREVIPVISGYLKDVEIAVDVNRARLQLWKRLGVTAVAMWSDKGLTDHNRATAEMVLSV